jgi:N-acetylmuramoyl-L-alanine amidase
MTKVVISSGHGTKIRGAAGPEPWGLDEVDEAIRVMARTADYLKSAGVEVTTYTDTVSTSQNENLERIVDFHNSKMRDLDVSIHFNAYEVTTTKKMGTECLFVNEEELAVDVAATIAAATNLPNRGAKYRGDLYFLNNTSAPAILVEVVFVDSKLDADAYRKNFEEICRGLAEAIYGEPVIPPGPEPEPPEPPPEGRFYAKGTCSWFGGPEDTGVSASEGLAFFYEYSDAPHLFLPKQPSGTTGLARRLNPDIFYVACRWDYDVISKEDLRNPSVQAIVRNVKTDKEFRAWAADWGPHEEQTGRAADLSPGLMAALDLDTDDVVEVIYPA